MAGLHGHGRSRPVVDAAPARYVRLLDGRALCYSEFGPPDGPVVVHLHGVPSSRLEALNEASTCTALGIRLIAPDRPGCGGSDSLEGREILDWPQDLEMLLDRLGVAEFGLLGVSGGAPYALACALRLRDRLTGVALVSPVGMIHDGMGLGGIGYIHRAFFFLSRSWPRGGRLLASVLLPVVDRAPGLMMATYRGSLCAADLAALEEAPPEIRATRNLVESASQGLEGPLRDFTLLAGPWGFSPEEVYSQVFIWHGDADGVIPLGHGEDLARRLPQAHLSVCPEEGHFLLAARMPEIVRELGWLPEGAVL